MRVTFKRIFIRTPSLRESDGSYRRIGPHECRLRGLSYNVSVYVDVLQETEDSDGTRKTQLYTEALLCRIPCMVRCIACSLRYEERGECSLDPGGYFIVNGNEKSVVAQEK